ncbi:spinocerebellar ataxia type 10 protein domain-containing protein [Mycena polygramma]|nr:spinocerebellar ataxia type 10 protein domain-containing protein [Mycena polygramma]KAJ7636074.1 spinocerebellar ataxia type 10 protein domain-containing protein [Mycena polygramma]
MRCIRYRFECECDFCRDDPRTHHRETRTEQKPEVQRRDGLSLHLIQYSRERLGEIDELWTDLRKLWRDLSRAQLTFWDNDDSDDDETDDAAEKEKQHGFRTLSANLARFTRNLVAGVPRNQKKAFENEPSIRRLLQYYTSWSFLKDEEAILVARVLAQALSNLVTGNGVLLPIIWNTYMNLPEDQVVLIRLLSSPDPRTLVAALVLIMNAIDGSRTRIKMLTRTTNGVRICISLLDSMVQLYDAEDATEGARAFDVGYEIFSRIMAVDLVPSLFTRLSMPDEIITPHQTTLLKLVDSYLQAARLSGTPTTPQGTPLYTKLRPMLAKSFFSLSTYAQHSIRNSLGLSSSSTASKQPPTPLERPDGTHAAFEPPSSLDVMLPKVSEALVLITQCIVTITLEASDMDAQAAGLEQKSQDFFNEATVADQGIVESLTELLRLLDLFLPRINFGKPVGPDGKAALPTPTQPQGGGDGADGTGFSYLKRDLVRLLGILCHGIKAVQDRARLCGGIEVVMNMCVIDERNPYLREHAIFTLHNLLEGNLENQAVVEAIKPSGIWDENGVLQTSGAVLR